MALHLLRLNARPRRRVSSLYSRRASPRAPAPVSGAPLPARSEHLLGVGLGVVLGSVPELLDRVGDIPMAAAVPRDGVEHAVEQRALDRPPDDLSAVARAEPHPHTD